MHRYDVGVVGLGYVGLTLATALAEVGMRVIGLEKRADVVDMTNAGKPHFSEGGLESALQRVTADGRLVARQKFEPDFDCKAYVITVGTPLDASGDIRLDMIKAASLQVAENMPDGALVILRSTVEVGTARNVVSKVLLNSGKNFDIAMCPERTLEGKAMQELRELPQIIGGDTPEVRARAAEIFSHLTNSVLQVSDLETAEIIKLIDNTYRDVQFAFANEVARLCDAFGANAYEVISTGKMGYKRTNVPLPGLVGGPCLEKDPHILAQSAAKRGIDLEITRASRIVNERQPIETVAFIIREMKRRKFPIDAPVALLGMAFKGVPATDDMRGSMSLKVLSALREAREGAQIRLFDPVIAPSELARLVPGCEVAASLDEALLGAAVVVIANNHPDLGSQVPVEMYAKMKPKGFVFDYWNHFSKLTPNEVGDSYFAVGNSGEQEKW